MTAGVEPTRGRGTGIPFVAGAARGDVGARELGPARTGADGGSLREFGELAPLVAEAAVTDVFVTAGQVWVDRGAGPEQAPLLLDAARARSLAIALVAAGGRHVDDSKPSFRPIWAGFEVSAAWWHVGRSVTQG